jgi:hypothetical protein
MSAFGPKQTSASALHMSAFGGKADITFCGISLLRSLLGVKRTWVCALHMSAYNPKRTSGEEQFHQFILLGPGSLGVVGISKRLRSEPMAGSRPRRMRARVHRS